MAAEDKRKEKEFRTHQIDELKTKIKDLKKNKGPDPDQEAVEINNLLKNIRRIKIGINL